MAQLAPGTIFNGRYRIERVLGAGGMGVVYQVLDQNTERDRALKVMLPTVVSNADMRSRFAREATVSAKIDSDHVAEVVDAGIEQQSGAPFIVMELLKGHELERLIHTQGARPIDEVLLYLSQASLALDKAHAHGIVHRDLKPENLYVTFRDDGTPRIKLLDFGIAKVINASMGGAQTQGILGTPLYMAPEQVHAKFPISARTDIYAMGHIAYTSLVGEAYFEEENLATESVYQLIVSIVDGPKEPASARAQRRRGVPLPPAFDAWFATATAPTAEARFQTCADMCTAMADAFGVAPSMRPAVGPSMQMPAVSAMQMSPHPPGGALTGSPTGAPRMTAPGTPNFAQQSWTPTPVPVHQAQQPGVSTVASAGFPTAGAPAATTTVGIAAPPPRARRDRGSSKMSWIIGGLVFAGLTAAGSALVLRGGESADRGTTETNNAARSKRNKKNQGKETPEPAPAEPTKTSTPAKVPPIVGEWQSTGSGLRYDAVFYEGRVEFRYRSGQSRKMPTGWSPGEPRFALIPIDGQENGYNVVDRIRPDPKSFGAYPASGPPTSCTRDHTDFSGTPLTATVDEKGNLVVTMVKVTHGSSHFATSGGKVLNCKRGVDESVVSTVQSKLKRM